MIEQEDEEKTRAPLMSRGLRRVVIVACVVIMLSAGVLVFTAVDKSDGQNRAQERAEVVQSSFVEAKQSASVQKQQAGVVGAQKSQATNALAELADVACSSPTRPAVVAACARASYVVQVATATVGGTLAQLPVTVVSVRPPLTETVYEQRPAVTRAGPTVTTVRQLPAAPARTATVTAKVTLPRVTTTATATRTTSIMEQLISRTIETRTETQTTTATATETAPTPPTPPTPATPAPGTTTATITQAPPPPATVTMPGPTVTATVTPAPATVTSATTETATTTATVTETCIRVITCPRP